MKKTIVRLHTNQGNFGTGVFISNEIILTARHVIDPDGDFVNDSRVKGETVSVESPNWMGKRVADELLLKKNNEIDLGIVILKPPKSIQLTECAAVHTEPHKIINVGDKVTVYGFNDNDKDIQVIDTRIISIDNTIGAYICDKALPLGFSGSGVFAKDGLVGIAFAQLFRDGQSYFYGGAAFLEMINLQKWDINWISSVGVSYLLEYPKGPAVTQTEIITELSLVMDHYIENFAGIDADRCIGKANQEREDCDVGVGKNAQILIHTLPNINFDRSGFWYGAFVQAGLKSPRMLAALLHAANPDLMTNEAHKQRNTFLEKLKKWKQSDRQ